MKCALCCSVSDISCAPDALAGLRGFPYEKILDISRLLGLAWA